MDLHSCVGFHAYGVLFEAMPFANYNYPATNLPEKHTAKSGGEATATATLSCSLHDNRHYLTMLFYYVPC